MCVDGIRYANEILAFRPTLRLLRWQIPEGLTRLGVSCINIYLYMCVIYANTYDKHIHLCGHAR